MFNKRKESDLQLNYMDSQQSILTSSPSTSRNSSNSFLGQFYDDDDENIYTDILSPDFDSGIIKINKEHNAVTQVIEEEAYCFKVPKFAEKLVDATFIEANKILTYKPEIIRFPHIPCDNETPEESTGESEAYESTLSEVDSVSKYWPKVSEFTIKLGMEKVEKFVEGWKRSSDWKYCVDFMGFECEDCSNIFVFQVEWSKPTMSYPIPQATANVFFAMDVYKMVPHNYDCHVEVTYIFECSTVIHRPGKIDFQEKWLEDILEAKLRFFKTITFSVPKGFCE